MDITSILSTLNRTFNNIEKKIKASPEEQAAEEQAAAVSSKSIATSVSKSNIDLILTTLNKSFVTINKSESITNNVSTSKFSVDKNIIQILNKSFAKISEQATDEQNKLKFYLISAMEYFISQDIYKDKSSSQHEYIKNKINQIRPSNSNIQHKISDSIKEIFKDSFSSTIITVAA